MRAGDVEADLDEVLGRRLFATGAFDLGGTPHGLSLVLAPCGRGRVREAGGRAPVELTVRTTPRGPVSSGFVTDAEVWTR